MGFRKIVVKQSAAKSIAAIAWFIESKGMLSTADKFIENLYHFFLKLADDRKVYAVCREPKRAILRYKCITYKKKYTIVLIESDQDIIICEFISSRLLHW